LRIYLTHCSAKKNNALRKTATEVFPDILYTATPIQRFMAKCKGAGVRWAIFSDLYGVWFPEVKRRWYEKNPNSVTNSEFISLVNDFDTKLQSYTEICFYYNPGRFHRLYKKLLDHTALKNKVVKITHLCDIV
jgi:hypothetical protein